VTIGVPKTLIIVGLLVPIQGAYLFGNEGKIKNLKKLILNKKLQT